MKPILYFLMLYGALSFGQSDVPLRLFSQFNGPYGYTIIGNTHNVTDNVTTPTAQCQLLATSTAALNLLPSQGLFRAYLHWSGIGDGTLNPTIKLNGTNYAPIETAIGYPENNLNISYFSSVADVTNQILSEGNGNYSFSNLNLNPLLNNYCSSGNYIAGWQIIVVYSDVNLANNQINIYNGANICSGFFNNGVTALTINNLNVTSTQNSKITYVTYNGSPSLFLNESVSINGNNLSNALNPANNPFNSTNSFTGSTTNWNQDIDTFDISSFINVGDTQANLTFKSFFYRFVQTLVTSIRSELPDATVQLNQVSGQETCNNRSLLVNYTVKNTNSNAVLPANIPVSFYADNVFLSTVNTPTPIAIGGVLPLQTTITVPLSVSNTFNLRVVVDNAVSATSTVAESNEANNASSQSVSFLNNVITPIFSVSNLICQNAPAPILPTTSSNNISGTWFPSIISNQVSGTYFFTPNAGQCAAPVTLTTTVTVLPVIMPAFSLQENYCQGDNVPILPLTSQNNITGSWLPSVINNQNSGLYVYTPSTAPNQCALSFALSVAITQKALPSFNILNTFCANAAVPMLPTVSTNGISGSWSPSLINNQNSGNYVFTPSAGICAQSSTLDVTISPIVSPTFNLQNSFCQNDLVPVLPATSTNNIVGTWSPAVINNQTSGNYVFTPNANQCALPFSFNVVVEPQIPISANLSICNDAQGNNIVPIALESGLNQSDYSFVWSLNNQSLSQNTTSISATTAGIYQLITTPNSVDCPQIFSFNVVSLMPIVATYSVSDDFETNQTITVSASGGSGQYEYSFNSQPFQNYPVFSVADGGEIVVKTRDSNGCYEISEVISLWQYPRFFTPNNDSFNDAWGINTSKKINVNVFDRFGKLIKNLTANERWNGTFNSQPLPADDYWFVLNYEGGKVFKGHFSLKR